MSRMCDVCETRTGEEQPGGIVVCLQCEEELQEEAQQEPYQRTETVGAAEVVYDYGT